MQGHSQHGQRDGEATPASGGLPEQQREDKSKASQEADMLSRGSSDGTPPLKGKTSKTTGKKS